jgi:hypothetical protein
MDFNISKEKTTKDLMEALDKPYKIHQPPTRYFL